MARPSLTLQEVTAAGERGFIGTLQKSLITIGSAPESDVRIEHASVRARHATLSRRPSNLYEITDEEGETTAGGIALLPGVARILTQHACFTIGTSRIEARVGPRILEKYLRMDRNELDVARAVIARERADRSSLPIKLTFVEGMDVGRAVELPTRETPYSIGASVLSKIRIGDAGVDEEQFLLLASPRAVSVKNVGRGGAILGGKPLARGELVEWSPEWMLRAGRAVLALHDPMFWAEREVEEEARSEGRKLFGEILRRPLRPRR